MAPSSLRSLIQTVSGGTPALPAAPLALPEPTPAYNGVHALRVRAPGRHGGRAARAGGDRRPGRLGRRFRLGGGLRRRRLDAPGGDGPAYHPRPPGDDAHSSALAPPLEAG